MRCSGQFITRRWQVEEKSQHYQGGREERRKEPASLRTSLGSVPGLDLTPSENLLCHCRVLFLYLAAKYMSKCKPSTA